jgi:transcriptional regulator
MYIPSHFAENRTDVLHSVIRAHPLGTLVVAGSGGLTAVHAPFALESDGPELGTLRCHLARANPIWRDCADGREALVIFRGVDAYVTPSWYATKRATGKVVPTYNYVAVHAKGVARAVEDPAWLHGLVTGLTGTFERRREKPWHVADAPADYVATMLKAIVGIEIPIASLVGTFKMSQNRAADDRAGVIEGLRERGADDDVAVSDLVRERGPSSS